MLYGIELNLEYERRVRLDALVSALAIAKL